MAKRKWHWFGLSAYNKCIVNRREKRQNRTYQSAFGEWDIFLGISRSTISHIYNIHIRPIITHSRVWFFFWLWYQNIHKIVVFIECLCDLERDIRVPLTDLSDICICFYRWANRRFVLCLPCQKYADEILQVHIIHVHRFVT